MQAIAGHTSPKMALRYQRAEMDYLAAIAGNVSDMIERSAKLEQDAGAFGSILSPDQQEAALARDYVRDPGGFRRVRTGHSTRLTRGPRVYS